CRFPPEMDRSARFRPLLRGFFSPELRAGSKTQRMRRYNRTGGEASWILSSERGTKRRLAWQRRLGEELPRQRRRQAKPSIMQRLRRRYDADPMPIRNQASDT